MNDRLAGLALLGTAMLSGLAPSRAAAEIGALDTVPAATLLFPYVEADAAGTLDTVLTIENVRAQPQLAHLVVWTDRGVPVLDFDLYLSPHGQQRIGLKALLAGQRPTSAAGAAQALCGFPLAPLSTAAVADLNAALTGQHLPSVADPASGCPGAPHGDTIARGYVTIDTVDRCGAVEASYWRARLSTSNALLGSFVIVHGPGLPAYGEQAIHIESSSTDPRLQGASGNTFYGALTDWTGADRRERLPTLWSAEFSASRSDVIAWREVKQRRTNASAIACGTAGQRALDVPGENLVWFDESESAADGGSGTDHPLRFASGRYPVGGSSGLRAPFRSGSVYVNGNFEVAGAQPLAQMVLLTVSRPDAVGAATHGTLALGSALDDGYLGPLRDPRPAYPATTEVGPARRPPPTMLNAAPGATLVLPYFEVSLDAPNAAQTTFTIAQASASAAVAKVTLYTDRGVPTLGFDVYLTGYDSQVIDLRALFTEGLVPRSATDGQDPADNITPQGQHSQDINYAACGSFLPGRPLDAGQVAFLRAAHTGGPAPEWAGQCGGRALGDNVARGYVAVDLVVACSFGPLDAIGLSTYLSTGNTLSGSFEVRNRTDGFSYAGSLISLHYFDPPPVPGDATFYGWLTSWVGTGGREPLPDVWRVPFVNEAALGTTELVWFRPVHRSPIPFQCTTPPAAFSGGVSSMTAYDGADASTTVTGFVPGFVAGRVAIGTGGIAVPYGRGAIEIDLGFAETDNPNPANPLAHMGYLGVVQRLAGSTDPVFVPGFPLHLAGAP